MTKLKKLRERRLMTQEELGLKAGVTNVTISRIESGKARPSFRNPPSRGWPRLWTCSRRYSWGRRDDPRAIYARVSTDEQAAKERPGIAGHGVRDTRRQSGYAVVEWSRSSSPPRATSASARTPGLLQMARAGAFDVLWSTTTRALPATTRVEDEGWLLTEFRWAGVKVEIVTGSDDPIHRMSTRYASGRRRRPLRAIGGPGARPPNGSTSPATRPTATPQASPGGDAKPESSLESGRA